MALPLAAETEPSDSLLKPPPAKGPLRIHPTNPCYFTDGTKLPDGSLKSIYLTGSHTRQNLQDGILRGYRVVKQPFDYAEYLDLASRTVDACRRRK